MRSRRRPHASGRWRSTQGVGIATGHRDEAHRGDLAFPHHAARVLFQQLLRLRRAGRTDRHQRPPARRPLLDQDRRHAFGCGGHEARGRSIRQATRPRATGARASGRSSFVAALHRARRGAVHGECRARMTRIDPVAAIRAFAAWTRPNGAPDAPAPPSIATGFRPPRRLPCGRSAARRTAARLTRHGHHDRGRRASRDALPGAGARP